MSEHRTIGAGVGLCDRCSFCSVVRSGKGSEFILCRLSKTDPAFPKYPKLPVLRCAGFTASTNDQQ